MSSIATRLLGLLIIGQVSAAVPPDLKQDPRLSQRPVVAAPACRAPKPYHAERWTVTSNRFFVSLVATLDREAADREARRLADGHKFEFDGSPALQERGGYSFTVNWLEPAQVAALRCESTVVAIDVGELVLVTSSGRY